MKFNPCQKAFDAGSDWRRTQRKTDPMRFSRYKIVETGKRWSDIRTELRKIGLCAGGETSACNALRHCVREDKSTWVKNLPESMLVRLGQDVVEVLYALRGDGVPQKQIDAMEAMVRAEVPRLISLGELARVEAKDDWKHLATSLASGGGYISVFVFEMQSLVEWVNQEIDEILGRP